LIDGDTFFFFLFHKLFPSVEKTIQDCTDVIEKPKRNTLEIENSKKKFLSKLLPQARQGTLTKVSLRPSCHIQKHCNVLYVRAQKVNKRGPVSIDWK
jgi:hypothetical protein